MLIIYSKLFFQQGDSLALKLREVHSAVQELHIAQKQVLQPYAVICGEHLNDIKYSIAVIGKTTYQLTSPFDAVDLVFKFTQAFQKEYSKFSNHIWYFLENQVYKNNNNNLARSVTKMIDQLNKYS